MEPINKKTLEHKLHIQHRNDKHDACEIVIEYFSEIQIANEALWKDCCTPPIFENGELISFGSTNEYRYNYFKKNP